MKYPAAAAKTSTRILIAVFGNRDRGDDGVGVLVLKGLAGRLPENVAVLECRGDTFSLLNVWDDFDMLICVDACVASGKLGRIHRIESAAQVLPFDLGPASSHTAGLAEVIALGQALTAAPPRIVVYAIEGVCFDVGAAPASEVVAAAAETVERIVAEIAKSDPGPEMGRDVVVTSRNEHQ